MFAAMEIFAWLVVQVLLKDVLKYVMIMLGVLSVMISGARLMLVLLVYN